MLLLRLVNPLILSGPILGFVFTVFISGHAQALLVEKILVVVNDSIITMTDVELYKKSLKTGELLNEMLSETEIKKLLNDNDALLDKLIDKKIIEHEVKKKGYAITDSQLEKEIRNIYRSYNMTKNELKKALMDKSFSFDEYLSFMRTNIERQNLISQEIASKITITDSDIANYYYSKNSEAPSSIHQYTVSQLYWNGEKLGEAKHALLSLKRGDISFDELVKTVGGSSGKLGTFKPNDFSKEFSAVLDLDPGEFSDVIKSPAGFHILRLDKKELIANPQIEAMRNELTLELSDQLLKARLESWLREKKGKSFIRINK